MDCRACGTINSAGRRYCRGCGNNLGQPCPACQFLNGLEDKYCGGCGRSLEGQWEEKTGPDAATSVTSPSRPVPLTDDMGLGDEDFQEIFEDQPAARETPLPEAAVSQSEIDNLFEKIREDSGEEDEERKEGEQQGEKPAGDNTEEL